jgi:hypothetical protein
MAVLVLKLVLVLVLVLVLISVVYGSQMRRVLGPDGSGMKPGMKPV